MSDLNSSSILDDVREIIAKQLKQDVSTVKENSVLTELGFDSLDVVEVIFALEEKFNIDIPFNANGTDSLQLKTVGQMTDAVRRLVNAKA